MQSLEGMIRSAAPFAFRFMLIAGGAAWVVLMLIRRRWTSVLLTLVSALYMGFLLHGTCVGRMDGWRDFFRVQLPDFDTVWWEFELAAHTDLTNMHAMYNVALFIPWGFLGMCWQRRGWVMGPVLLGGIVMSVFIEFFQVTHGMVFDMGDVLTNSVGALIGCIAGLPVTGMNALVYHISRKKRRKKYR